ncbi:MAG: hypothetical protein HZA82_03385 [Thaumarchaeota archaeon]|nr:hypothetical protein [Nitrososphaerota archaeon]
MDEIPVKIRSCFHGNFVTRRKPSHNVVDFLIDLCAECAEYPIFEGEDLPLPDSKKNIGPKPKRVTGFQLGIDSYYSRIHGTFSKRKQKTTEIYDELFQNTCYWIGFQHWLDSEIAEDTERHPKEWANLQKQIGHSLYTRNLHYLYAAVDLASMGLVDPCLNLLRTVYESMLKMYYLALFPDEADAIQNDMDKRIQKYAHGLLVEKLYTKETGAGCKRFFKLLSEKSHSNYSGMGHTVTYSPKHVEDCLRNILTLSFYNILAELENQITKPSMLEPELFKKIEPKCRDLLSTISSKNNTIAKFIPDKPEFAEKLGCHL